jgi:hypothetical protein
MRIGRCDTALGVLVILGVALVAAIYLIPDRPPTVEGDLTADSVMSAHPELAAAECPDRPVKAQDRFECRVTLAYGTTGTVEVTPAGEEGFLAIGAVELDE